MSRDRYRAIARYAGIRRPSRRLVLDAALVVALVLATFVAMPRVVSGAGAGAEQLISSLRDAIPLLQGRDRVDLSAGAGAAPVGAAPIVEGLPQFTSEPQLRFSGRVPAFAVQPGRRLQVTLNGAVLSTTALDPSGTFSVALALKEGPNAIAIALLTEREVVATSTYSVALDRTPPSLSVSRPQAGSVVDAQNVVVQGSTESGSTLTINGHNVFIGSDGAFSDSFTAAPGPLEIAVVARDRAGNETTQKVGVTAERSSGSGATLTVVLDRGTVRPGQQVLATITLRDTLGPRADALVALSVGVVFIGDAVTDATGVARIGFAAPPNEGTASVVVLAAGVSGSASLTVTTH